ncbi:hypothetical protein WQE_22673 [Paraburkholderia hospita]|uniref:Uncharacterized protein n=1 Tax=Paraburkholderia hospita TaxID=169430 RepID=A0ABN0FIW9_9BURK|nr:hypothetical protein [Paraburkholderia hospita]EIM98716.1 hypothetical protein WQE_22673 [Paraburkholderia hospita]OUL87701.1 hypothetical protein CA602_13265 [Paraburkholderia hospita]
MALFRKRFSDYWDLVRECNELGMLCEYLDEVENHDRRPIPAKFIEQFDKHLARIAELAAAEKLVRSEAQIGPTATR